MTNKNLINQLKSKQTQSFLNAFFDSLDNFISTHIDPPLHPSIDPKHVLSSNNTPLSDELPPTPCEVVEGTLPSCLNGVYLRNGPNPQFYPKCGPYHLFDGDGMIQLIKISQGKACFCSRYVRTDKFVKECDVGHSLIPSIFASFIVGSIARYVLTFARLLVNRSDIMSHGFGTANTSISVLNGRIFALYESDLPYQIKVTPNGDILTINRENFESDDDETFFMMTAHPKVDRITGEAFAYRYNIERPFLTYFRINPILQKQKDVPIWSTNGSKIIHDFAITRNYAIFPDIQVGMNPMSILRGNSIVAIDPSKVTRLGVISKYAQDDREMWWVDVPRFNLVHCVNAWEEEDGDIIVLVASNMVRIDEYLERADLAESSMERIVIDVKARTLLQRQVLSPESLDLSVINPSYATKKTRYIYSGVKGTRPDHPWVGVVKLDLSQATSNHDDCTVASRFYGPGSSGGEPFFVPKNPNNPDADEDDGHVVTYLHDGIVNESYFLVMDAKSSDLDIVAKVKLPRRVSNGFHGLFLSESDLVKLEQ